MITDTGEILRFETEEDRKAAAEKHGKKLLMLTEAQAASLQELDPNVRMAIASRLVAERDARRLQQEVHKRRRSAKVSAGRVKARAARKARRSQRR